jgi:hypothetical protein
VTSDGPPGPGLSTTNDALAWSNAAACAWPANGRTTPAGTPLAWGDTAASAGTIVGGEASGGFDEHPEIPESASTNRPTRTNWVGGFKRRGKG